MGWPCRSRRTGLTAGLTSENGTGVAPSAVEGRRLAIQCGILFIGARAIDHARIASLRALGFRVSESTDIPNPAEVEAHHALVVHSVRDRWSVVGARLRGMAHLDRRALLALVPADTPDRDKRDAVMSGFDVALTDACSARDIASQVLRLLRAYPDYRCLLRAPNGRRKAA